MLSGGTGTAGEGEMRMMKMIMVVMELDLQHPTDSQSMMTIINLHRTLIMASTSTI